LVERSNSWGGGLDVKDSVALDRQGVVGGGDPPKSGKKLWVSLTTGEGYARARHISHA